MKNNIDLAIKGEGYFVVKEPEKETLYYTRKGNFVLKEDGYVITDCGKSVLDQNNKPLLGENTKQIKIAIFEDGKTLKYIKNGLFSSNEKPKGEGGEVKVIQSTQMNTEVDLAGAFVELLEKQNEVAINPKVIIPLNEKN